MPEWKPEILRRLSPLKLAPTREAEVTDELSQHLEDRYQELLASGQSEDTAFRSAARGDWRSKPGVALEYAWAE